MPVFEEEGAYCFANVGRSVGGSVCLSVCLSVNEMVSDHSLENYLSQSFRISHTDMFW